MSEGIVSSALLKMSKTTAYWKIYKFLVCLKKGIPPAISKQEDSKEDRCTLTCKITLRMSSFTGSVKDWHVPWKHQRTMPPLENIVKRSNITTLFYRILSLCLSCGSLNHRFHLIFHLRRLSNLTIALVTRTFPWSEDIVPENEIVTIVLWRGFSEGKREVRERRKRNNNNK